MLTNVAESGGAEQRVGDRVKDDTGVAVACEAARMRNRNAAQHDRSFRGERMDVEAHPRPRDHCAGKPLPGTGPIRSGGELLERWVAGNRGDAQTGSASNGGLIGRSLA